jgi:hypothetical protein
MHSWAVSQDLSLYSAELLKPRNTAPECIIQVSYWQGKMVNFLQAHQYGTLQSTKNRKFPYIVGAIELRDQSGMRNEYRRVELSGASQYHLCPY